MKIIYIGLDFLSSALDALLTAGCEVMELYTCKTDNKTEFNTYMIHMAEKLGISIHLERIRKSS